MKMDDEKIVELYFARNEDAIRETDRSYGRELFAFSFRILANREDAEENLDDTYLSTWNAIPPTRPVNLAAFLHRICRNHALNRLERSKTAKRGAAVAELTAELANCIPGGDVEADVQARELGRLLTAFLKQLPGQERYIFVARCFYLDSPESIAKDLGCSAGRVRTILYRTRLHLKEFLARNE